MSLSEALFKFAERHVFTDKNLERFVKYYWIISTFRLVVGFTVMFLICFEGYKLYQLVPKM